MSPYMSTGWLYSSLLRTYQTLFSTHRSLNIQRRPVLQPNSSLQHSLFNDDGNKMLMIQKEKLQCKRGIISMITNLHICDRGAIRISLDICERISL